MTISGQKEMLWCICGLASDGSPETTYLRCFQDFDTFLVIPDVAGSSPVIRPRLKMAPFGAFFDLGRMAGRSLWYPLLGVSFMFSMGRLLRTVAVPLGCLAL